MGLNYDEIGNIRHKIQSINKNGLYPTTRNIGN